MLPSRVCILVSHLLPRLLPLRARQLPQHALALLARHVPVQRQEAVRQRRLPLPALERCWVRGVGGSVQGIRRR